MLDQLRERVSFCVDLRGSSTERAPGQPEYAKTVNNAAAGPERPPVKNVSRPLGRRGGDYRVSSLQAEVILTTLTTKTAKRIQLNDGEDRKAMRNRLRSWFRRHHAILKFHFQMTADGTAGDCWVTKRKGGKR